MCSLNCLHNEPVSIIMREKGGGMGGVDGWRKGEKGGKKEGGEKVCTENKIKPS